MAKPVCLVTGVGPGTGAAIVRRFAKAYQVAMLARNADRLAELAADVPNAHGFPCDVADADALAGTLAGVADDLGAPDILVHNAVGGAFGEFTEIEPEVLERNFAVNTVALLRLAQSVAPAMVERGRGAIICTGNTAALPRQAALRRVRADQGCAANPRRIHGAFARAQRRPCRLRGHRCRDRLGMDPAAFARPAGRVLLQARRHRRRGLAPRPPAEERLDLRRDDSPVRRSLVGRGSQPAAHAPAGRRRNRA